MTTKANKLWAKVQAIEVLRRYAVTDAAEIDVEAIAWSLGAVVREGPLREAEARLLYSEGAEFATIRVREDLPEEGRRRFAIAHELGHWILHRDQSQLHLFTVGDLGLSYANSALEIEANTFASELLMPERLFKSSCDSGNPSLALIARLSDAFRTTLSATAMRFVEFCPEHCAVVFSKSGKIKRWHTGEHTGIWINAGDAVPQDSFAFDALAGKSVPTEMESVPGSSWFPTLPPVADRTVMENSMRLGHYDTVLTLLWIPADADP